MWFMCAGQHLFAGLCNVSPSVAVSVNQSLCETHIYRKKANMGTKFLDNLGQGSFVGMSDMFIVVVRVSKMTKTPGTRRKMINP